jgi:hypothetical protein
MNNKLISGLEHFLDVGQYPELTIFRTNVEKAEIGPQHRPYQTHQKNIRRYRSIFVSLGILFGIFCFVIYSKGITWAHPYLFSDAGLMKTMVCSLCALLSFFAFGIAFAISPELEAILALRRQARMLLRGIYRMKMNELGVQRILPTGESEATVVKLKQGFRKSLHELNTSYKITEQLMETIRVNPSIDEATKAKLYNQAIFELNDAFYLLLTDYQK